MNLGEAIKKYRSEHENMSQREFGRACGLSHVYIMNLEKGYDPKSGKENTPTLTTIAAIAKGMGRPVADLLEMIAEVVSVQGLSEDQKNMVRGMIDYLRRGGE